MKSLIIKHFINSSLRKFDKNIKPLKFINKNEKSNLSNLVDKTDIYLIDDKCLSHYYIYEEAGRPLLCTKYYNLHDIIYITLWSEFFEDITMKSMQLTYSIDSVKDKELRDYLIKQNVESLEYPQKIVLSIDISKYYYNFLYQKLDSYTNNFLFRMCDNFIFDNTKIKKKDIFGRWLSMDTIREYNEEEFKIISKTGNGLEIIKKCFLLDVLEKTIIMNVKSKDKLDYEERLFLSKDKNTLIIYNYNGRTLSSRL